MKMTVFWDVAPCSLAEVDRRFRGAYCLYQGDHPEPSASFYQTTWRNIPEDSHLRSLSRSNEAALGPYPEPDKSGPYLHILFL
jgi:hypothetical protein